MSYLFDILSSPENFLRLWISPYYAALKHTQKKPENTLTQLLRLWH